MPMPTAPPVSSPFAVTADMPPAEPGFPHSIGNSFEPATILASKTNGFHDIHMEGRGFEHRRTWDGAHYQQR